MTSSSDDKQSRRIRMKVEEIADEKEEKRINKEEPVPQAVIPSPPPEEEEKKEEAEEIKENMQKEEAPLEGLAREQQKESLDREMPKKDIVSELFRTNETTVSYPDVTIQKKPKKFSVLIWIILLFVIVGCIGGGLLFFKQQSSSPSEVSPQEENNITVTLTSTPSPTDTQTPVSPTQGATPTASASAKKKGITVQVWNGSGKSGAASLMKELLEENGYTVKSTGNAPSFSKDATAIYVKKSKKEYLDLLKKDIGEKYSLGTTSATLDENLTFDARVIVGEE